MSNALRIIQIQAIINATFGSDCFYPGNDTSLTALLSMEAVTDRTQR